MIEAASHVLSRKAKLVLALLGLFIPAIYIHRNFATFSQKSIARADVVSGDAFRSLADRIIYSRSDRITSESMFDGMIVFVKTDFFKTFANMKRTKKFIVITHDSDFGPPVNSAFLNDSNLLMWYAQNVDGTVHRKLRAIPIGIANAHWPHGNLTILRDAVARHRIPFVSRKIKICLNFMPRDELRRAIHRHFCVTLKQDGIVCKEPKSSFAEYLADMGNSQFVISPPGNGIDCHRTWESVAMGAIPVVLRDGLAQLFENTPTVLVDDYKKVTYKELLKSAAKILPMLSMQPATSKLYLSYWRSDINAVFASSGINRTI